MPHKYKEHYRRVRELLEANNRLVEENRALKRKLLKALNFVTSIERKMTSFLKESA